MQTIKRIWSWWLETFKKQNLIGKLIFGIVSLCIICFLISLPISLLSPEPTPTPDTVAEGDLPTDTPIPEDTPTPESIDTPEPTATPLPPTETPEPTNTPGPTSTPTETPLPTDTPTPEPTPTPAVFSGSGDSVVSLNKSQEPMIIHISGNAQSQHFAVESYDAAGNYLELLANTIEPYDGVRPIDFLEDHHTTRLQVTAVGDWRIELMPITAARVLSVPGEISGNGDDVIILNGTPDVATISGNQAASNFAVIGYGTFPDLLVNTIEPYQGQVIVEPDTVVLEVNATGPWTIVIEQPA